MWEVETTDVLVQLKELFGSYLSRVERHQTVLDADIIQGSARKSRLWIAAKEIERIVIEVTAYACWVRLASYTRDLGTAVSQEVARTQAGVNDRFQTRAHVPHVAKPDTAVFCSSVQIWVAASKA